MHRNNVIFPYQERGSVPRRTVSLVWLVVCTKGCTYRVRVRLNVMVRVTLMVVLMRPTSSVLHAFVCGG